MNCAEAEVAKAKKDRKKAKKERAKLQHGRRWQGSEESDDNEEEDPNIQWACWRSRMTRPT